MQVEASPRSKSALLLVIVVVFINIAGFSLILPLLPFYGHELNASPVQITMLFAAYSFGNVFGEIWWGRASDRYGRKRVLMITTAGAALGYIAFAFVPTLWLALLIRAVTGFFGGTLGVCQSYIADVTRPEERPKSMGYFGAGINMGFVIGPAIGGLLAQPELGLAGFRPPIFVAAAFCALSALWSALVLKDSQTPGTVRRAPDWSEAFRFVGSNPLLIRLFALAFIGIGALRLDGSGVRSVDASQLRLVDARGRAHLHRGGRDGAHHPVVSDRSARRAVTARRA